MGVPASQAYGKVRLSLPCLRALRGYQMQLQKKAITGGGRQNSHEIHVASPIEYKGSLGKATKQEDSKPNILFFVSPAASLQQDPMHPSPSTEISPAYGQLSFINSERGGNKKLSHDLSFADRLLSARPCFG